MILMKVGKDAIKGESMLEGYKDWINIDTMGFGVGRHIQTTNDNRTASQPGVSEISLTRGMDGASTELYFQSVGGGSLGDVEIHVVETGNGTKPQVTTKLILSNSIITSFSSSSSGDRPLESISLNFTKMSWEVFKWTGDKSSSSGVLTYDLTTGQQA